MARWGPRAVVYREIQLLTNASSLMNTLFSRPGVTGEDAGYKPARRGPREKHVSIAQAAGYIRDIERISEICN